MNVYRVGLTMTQRDRDRLDRFARRHGQPSRAAAIRYLLNAGYSAFEQAAAANPADQMAETDEGSGS